MLEGVTENTPSKHLPHASGEVLRRAAPADQGSQPSGRHAPRGFAETAPGSDSIAWGIAGGERERGEFE